jgi:hypothetical protein
MWKRKGIYTIINFMGMEDSNLKYFSNSNERNVLFERRCWEGESLPLSTGEEEGIMQKVEWEMVKDLLKVE